MLGRLLGVILALLGIGMLGGILFALPAPLLVGGMVLVVVAEWMVAQRRVYRSGVEEVLYLCGVVGVVAQFLLWGDSRSIALAALLLSSAVLLVGWRLLNRVFTTLALAGYSLAIGLFDANFFDSDWNVRWAGIFCAVVALLALSAGARRWSRPSHDHMCDGLIIVMPWLCYAWLTASAWQDRAQNYMALVAALFFFGECLFVGIRRRCLRAADQRHGQPAVRRVFIAQPAALAAASGAHRGGRRALVVAIVIERRLRDRTAGLTVKALNEPAGLELLQLAAVAHLAPPPGAAHPQQCRGRAAASLVAEQADGF